MGRVAHFRGDSEGKLVPSPKQDEVRAGDSSWPHSWREVVEMPNASGRFSMRRLLRRIPADDQPAAESRAEKLLARLCARTCFAEQVRGPGTEDEPPLPEEGE